jgi:double-stranded uracil-DNA glycosylase
MKSVLPPVTNKRTEVLILGSFPGEESIRQQQYYANNRNHFWRIMERVLEEKMYGRPYQERLQILLRHRIGLWDAYAACDRQGSLDGDITNGEHNDFTILKALAPKLRIVCFNGKTAASCSHLLEEYKQVLLTSSSSANALSVDQKAHRWRKALSEAGVSP